MDIKIRLELLRSHIDRLENVYQNTTALSLDEHVKTVLRPLWDCLVDFENLFQQIGYGATTRICLTILREYLPIFLSRKPGYLHYVRALDQIEEQARLMGSNYRISVLRKIPNDPAATAYRDAIFNLMVALHRIVDSTEVEIKPDFPPWHANCRDIIDIMLNTWCMEATGNIRMSRYDDEDEHVRRSRQQQCYQMKITKLREWSQLIWKTKG